MQNKIKKTTSIQIKFKQQCARKKNPSPSRDTYANVHHGGYRAEHKDCENLAYSRKEAKKDTARYTEQKKSTKPPPIEGQET